MAGARGVSVSSCYLRSGPDTPGPLRTMFSLKKTSSKTGEQKGQRIAKTARPENRKSRTKPASKITCGLNEPFRGLDAEALQQCFKQATKFSQLNAMIQIFHWDHMDR